MRILEIKNMVRKDVPIYYRRLFSGDMVFDITGRTIFSHIEFTLETKPTGASEVIINSMEPVDYPLLPLRKEVRKFILSLDDNGSLPL